MPEPPQRTDDCESGIHALSQAFRSGVTDPQRVALAHLERIASIDAELRCYVSIRSDAAIADAKRASWRLRRGRTLGPLDGIPIAIKDNIAVRALPMTAGSEVLRDSPPQRRDASVVRALKRAGAVILGKTNMTEFAVGEPDPNAPFGEVQNPRALSRQAGSSSSGSAAAVATGLAVVALGTDTGGSVRHPASVCGVVGFKPSRAALPTAGIMSLSPYLDHVGILGRSVADVRAVFLALCGGSVSGDAALTDIRVGSPAGDEYDFGDPAIISLLRSTVARVGDAGVRVRAVGLPSVQLANEAAATLIAADAVRSISPYLHDTDGVGSSCRARLANGRAVAPAAYAAAVRSARQISDSWDAVTRDTPIVMMPANVIGAPPLGVTDVTLEGTRYPVRLLSSRYSRLANLAGAPALVLPIGETPDRLPVAIQLVGRRGQDNVVLSFADRLEALVGNWAERWGIEPRAYGSSQLWTECPH